MCNDILHTPSIECHVQLKAQKQPYKTAVEWSGGKLTYRQLWDAATAKAVQLKHKGVTRGCLHLFRTTQDGSFIVSYIATHLIGAVAVPLGADLPSNAYGDLVARYSNIRIAAKGDTSKDIADVLFTTGSTGKQKGVMLSYQAIMADTENLIEAQGFSAETVFVVCGPLNHIGSLSKIWPVLVQGGTLVILDGMKNLSAFFEAFRSHEGKLATFMVPASIRLLLGMEHGELRAVADKIDFLETGGAAITQPDMEALCSALPTARLYNTYASTETGIICTYDYNHNPCTAGCLGLPMVNSTVEITADGRIACGGKTLMSGYLQDPALTAQVLHGGKVFTNDLGHIDADGRLHMMSRSNDVINTGGYKVPPSEVEDVAMAHPAIADCVCCAATSPIFGDTVKLFYVVSDGKSITKQELARHLASRLENYKVPRLYEQVPAIKRLYNGKLDRLFYSTKR